MSEGVRRATRSAPERGREFLVEVTTLRRTGGERLAIERRAPLEGLAVSGSAVPEGEEVRIVGTLEAVHEGILVSGTVIAPWLGSCRRCLEEARGELVVEVRELCVEEGDEETTYPLTPSTLDLRPIIHDACILELPLAPLCREDCRGLCPECGTNRNLELCSCRPSRDDRWAALAVLEGGGETTPVSERTTS